MKRIIRTFEPADRYAYDFGACSIDRGWAQVDTSQDASYFGQWINPTDRKIACYCEGDVIVTHVDTDSELVAEIAAMQRWNLEQGHRFLGIDPGFNEPLKQALITVGLEEYLH